MKKLLGLLAVAPMALAACGGTEASEPSKTTYVVSEDDSTVTAHYIGHGKSGEEASVKDGGNFNVIVAIATFDETATADTVGEVSIELFESTGYVNPVKMGYSLSDSDINENARYINSLFNITSVTKEYPYMEMKTETNYGSDSFRFPSMVSTPAETQMNALTCAEIKAKDFDVTKKDGTGNDDITGSTPDSSTPESTPGAGDEVTETEFESSEYSLYLAAMQDVANKACSTFEATTA